MTEKQVRGALGEQAAVDYLRQNGFMIVERNYRVGKSEVDIIATRYDELHFVEVKTRKLGGWQSPYDSITKQKCDALRKGALAYRTIHRIPLEIEFDLIAIIIDDHGNHTLEYTEHIF